MYCVVRPKSVLVCEFSATPDEGLVDFDPVHLRVQTIQASDGFAELGGSQAPQTLRLR